MYQEVLISEKLGGQLPDKNSFENRWILGTSENDIQAFHEEDVERKASLGEDGMPPGRSTLESDTVCIN